MTATDITREILATYHGRIMRKLDSAGFKVVVIVGVSTRGDKLRACVWSDNKRKWSKPQLPFLGQLEEINLDAITERQRATVGHALANIKHDNRNEVVFQGGAIMVGVPWVTKTSTRDQPAGVTKLASVQSTVVNRDKLKKLNTLMCDALFGGRK